MKAVTKKLTVLSTEPGDKMKLARRTFTLEFKADVVRHRKDENLSWTDAGKAFDVLPKLVKEWEALYDKGLLTGEAGRRTVSPEQAQIGALRSELSRLKMENQILKKAAAQPLVRAVAASLGRACEVRLYESRVSAALPGCRHLPRAVGDASGLPRVAQTARLAKRY